MTATPLTADQQRVAAQFVYGLTNKKIARSAAPCAPASLLALGPHPLVCGPGLVVHVSSEDGEAFDAWAGATHRSALDQLAELPIDWNRFDG
ncbi:hypothetical protein ACWDU8_07430 [Streptomyces sp. NPDC003388]